MILKLTEKQVETLKLIRKLEVLLGKDVVELICDVEESMGWHSKTKYKGFRKEIDELADAVYSRKEQLKLDFYKDAMEKGIDEQVKK